ncbi:MAG: hypothetical protein EOO54_28585 [Haliea sp.]|nr:MAG: hypothetical protein EOO54_28585 [Haliea sp.]
MSIFNWFSGKSSTGHQAPGKAPVDHDSAGQNRDRASTPGTSRPAGTEPRSGAHKSHRHARRELLYAAVREAMIRAGVLSASYKFKVLSLDPRGEQFMVMMDLSQEFGGQTDRLAEIEVMIAQSAKLRYDIRVTAVYWRMNELVSVAQPAAGAVQNHSRPAPLYSPEAAPAPAVDRVVVEPAAVKPVVQRYEPIQADEVAAFKQALAAASAHGLPAQAAAPADGRGPGRSAPRSYTLLTGFEDTEMPDAPAMVPALSATQYGDLN